MKKREKAGSTDLNRREFLKTMAGVGAVAAISPLAAPAIARGAAKEIKIGMVLPYSGVWSTLGRKAEAGIRFAFHKSAYKDRVKFFLEDSREDPAVCVEKAQKLVEKEGVDIIVGPAAGHTALAVSEYCKSKKKLMLLVYGGNVKIAGENCSRYTFMVGHTTYSVSAPGVPWCVQNLGKEVFLIGNDYSTGRDITGYFEAGYKKLGGVIVGRAYPKLGTSEYAPYLAQIKAATPRPKVVAGFLSTADLINFTKQFDEFGLKREKISIVLTIGGYAEGSLPAIGDAAIGHYDIIHYSPWLTNKENVDFKNEFAKFSSEILDDPVVLGYDVGTTMIYGLDKTGGDPNNEAMIDAIAKRVWKGPRGECSFGPNHCVIHPVYVRQIQKVEGQLRTIPVAYVGQHGTPGTADGPGGQCKL